MKNAKFEEVINETKGELAVVDAADIQVQQAVEITIPMVTLDESEYLNYLDLADSLETIKPQISLTLEYFDFAKNPVTRGVFMGTHYIYKTDKLDKTKKIQILCIKWVDSQRKIWLHGGAALVSQFINKDTGELLVTLGTRVEISLTGKRGDCNLFSISLLG
jgi:hypothetical protein